MSMFAAVPNPIPARMKGLNRAEICDVNFQEFVRGWSGTAQSGPAPADSILHGSALDAQGFRELFGSEGSEIYLRPASAYVVGDAEIDFHTVIEAAARRGETAIGYREAATAEAPGSGYGVRVNPRKPARRVYAPGDQVIVLAEA